MSDSYGVSPDESFRPYRHLAICVLVRALRDMVNPNGASADRESARIFLNGSGMLLHWCHVAALDPTVIASLADKLAGSSRNRTTRYDEARRAGRPLPVDTTSEGSRMPRLFRSFTLVLGVMLTGVSLIAQNKEQGRLENAGLVLEEILNLPDSIPQALLDKAECVIVVPSMTRVAIGIGGSYGRGAMVCRSGASSDGPWGAPAMYALEGGSFGLQLGAQSTDLVLLVMNTRGVEALLNSKVQLGANMSAAAGPKGRDIGASTDASLRAEMLSYSRSRGVFAGVSLEGTSLRPDDDASAEIYGHTITAKEIVRGNTTNAPGAGRRLVDVLRKKASHKAPTPASRQ